MPEAKFILRIQAIEDGSVKRTFDVLGSAGETAFARLQRGVAGAQTNLLPLDKAVGGVVTGMRDMASTIAVIDGPLGGVASRFNALATVITRASLATGLFAAGIGLLLITMRAAFRVQSDWEQALDHSQHIIEGTGNAAVVTADQLAKIAESISADTLGNSTEALNALAQALTFQGVNTSNMEHVVRAAQGMTEIFGGTLATNVEILGRAAERGGRALNTLSAQGVNLSNEETKLINQLIAVGDHAGALTILLTALDRANITSAGNVKGLAGAWDDVSDAYERFMHTGGLTGGLQTAFHLLAGGIDALTLSIKAIKNTLGAGVDFDPLEQAVLKIFDLQQKIASFKGSVGPPEAHVVSGQLAELDAQLAAANQKVAQIEAARAKGDALEKEIANLQALPTFAGPADKQVREARDAQIEAARAALKVTREDEPTKADLDQAREQVARLREEISKLLALQPFPAEVAAQAGRMASVQAEEAALAHAATNLDTLRRQADRKQVEQQTADEKKQIDQNKSAIQDIVGAEREKIDLQVRLLGLPEADRKLQAFLAEQKDKTIDLELQAKGRPALPRQPATAEHPEIPGQPAIPPNPALAKMLADLKLVYQTEIDGAEAEKIRQAELARSREEARKLAVQMKLIAEQPGLAPVPELKPVPTPPIEVTRISTSLQAEPLPGGVPGLSQDDLRKLLESSLHSPVGVAADGTFLADASLTIKLSQAVVPPPSPLGQTIAEQTGGRPQMLTTVAGGVPSWGPAPPSIPLPPPSRAEALAASSASGPRLTDATGLTAEANIKLISTENDLDDAVKKGLLTREQAAAALAAYREQLGALSPLEKGLTEGFTSGLQDVQTELINVAVRTESWSDALDNLALSFQRLALQAATAPLFNILQTLGTAAIMGAFGSQTQPTTATPPPGQTGPGGLLGHAQHGGTFTVGGSGGPDTTLVKFWATPGEEVVVRPPGMAGQLPVHTPLGTVQPATLRRMYKADPEAVRKLLVGHPEVLQQLTQGAQESGTVPRYQHGVSFIVAPWAHEDGAWRPSQVPPAFQQGGHFTVGGTGGPDTTLVKFWATPGEQVVVRPATGLQAIQTPIGPVQPETLRKLYKADPEATRKLLVGKPEVLAQLVQGVQGATGPIMRYQHGGAITVPLLPAVRSFQASVNTVASQYAPVRAAFWGTPGEEVFIRPPNRRGFAEGGAFTIGGGQHPIQTHQGNVTVNVSGVEIPEGSTQRITERTDSSGNRIIDVMFESKLRQSFRNRSMDSTMMAAFGARRVPVQRS